MKSNAQNASEDTALSLIFVFHTNLESTQLTGPQIALMRIIDGLVNLVKQFFRFF